MPKVHVIYNGTKDIDFEELFRDSYNRLGIQPDTLLSSENLTEQQVKMALAQYFDVSLNEFEDHHVDFAPNRNITVRPHATFAQ